MTRMAKLTKEHRTFNSIKTISLPEDSLSISKSVSMTKLNRNNS